MVLVAGARKSQDKERELKIPPSGIGSRQENMLVDKGTHLESI